MNDKALLCESCGAALKSGAKFCSKCGAKVIEKKYCAKCGTELDPGDLFCSACGAPVDGEAEPSRKMKPAGKTEVKVVNDSGYYPSEPRYSGHIHVNTPDFYFFVLASYASIARVDKNMAGKWVSIHNEYAVPHIEAMSIVDGTLAVLVAESYKENHKHYLEYFTLDLEFIRSEQADGLIGLAEESESMVHFRMNDSHVFEIVEEYDGQKYYDCKILAYDIASKRTDIIPVVLDGSISWVNNIWLHRDKLYISLSGDKKDEDGDDDPFEYLLRVDTEYKAVEILCKRYEDNYWPEFFDFEKDVMWTYLTDAECKRLGLITEERKKYLGARKIKQEAPILKEYPVWKFDCRESGFSFNRYYKSYFDGEFMFIAPSYWEFHVYTKSGDEVKWPLGRHGRTETAFVWNDKIIGDLCADHKWFYRPKQLQYENGIKIEGIGTY